ncbi:MAG: hypothetical protein Q4F41_19980 [Eubacteriales bacterium]|nr:hypothetical protein [Eubacteriales bacterium]
MKEVLKRKIALYLSILLVLPTVFGLLPARAEAATEIYYQDPEMWIEVGQSFYIGDYVNVITDTSATMLSMCKASYTSSKPSVVSIDKKTGLAKAKKQGIARITAKYAGKKAYFEIEVVKKKTLGTTTTYKKLAQQAEKVAKVFESDPAEAIVRCAQYGKEIAKINQNSEKLGWYLGSNGIYEGVTKKGVKSCVLAPMGGRAATLMTVYNPLATRSAKVFRPTKMTASVKKNTLTVTLKEKATDAQVAWLSLYGGVKQSVSKKKAQFFVSLISDVTAGKYYYGIGTVKTGSKEITVKLTDINTGKRVKIVKGHKYKLMEKGSWGLGKTAVAK